MLLWFAGLLLSHRISRPELGKVNQDPLRGFGPGTSATDGVPKAPTAKEWGCVSTAGALLSIACESECGSACRLKPSSECALTYFAQTNTVKCTPPKSGMAFVAERRIAACMAKNLFSEIELLQPEVIVLHGRSRNLLTFTGTSNVNWNKQMG
jgi:hypothetical protein